MKKFEKPALVVLDISQTEITLPNGMILSEEVVLGASNQDIHRI